MKRWGVTAIRYDLRYAAAGDPAVAVTIALPEPPPLKALQAHDAIHCDLRYAGTGDSALAVAIARPEAALLEALPL
ncbi:MAG TPA: hypothetical protein VHW09_23570 [Bryobacteraceae bacterium]|jgi:hypothetical protein|nr:hypothetical protein [Bryobacteraceae bacterium]